ncbi:Dihydropyrimidine dehydrogenase [Operophtera brumata]|uniref:Dihydropyrimidine dehydrogenase n=1 Tax=Operophtera brumata TaxID=104452 RepID=A0A0L7L0P0_OPEBR|nr:Dihydropyrimidine dehydrogenase [Operophtera brumata]
MGLPGWIGQSPPTFKHQKGKPVQTLYGDDGKASLIVIVIEFKLVQIGNGSQRKMPVQTLCGDDRKVLAHFGPYNQKREEQLHTIRLKSDILQDNKVDSYTKANGVNGHYQVPRIQDVLGEALPRSREIFLVLINSN